MRLREQRVRFSATLASTAENCIRDPKLRIHVCSKWFEELCHHYFVVEVAVTCKRWAYVCVKLQEVQGILYQVETRLAHLEYKMRTSTHP